LAQSSINNFGARSNLIVLHASFIALKSGSFGRFIAVKINIKFTGIKEASDKNLMLLLSPEILFCQDL